MEWNDKVEMVKLLNQNKNKEATEYYLAHEDWQNWNDVQALSMYANGINLTNHQDCLAIKDKLTEIQMVHEERYADLDFRAAIRIATLQDEFENGTIFDTNKE